MLQVSAICLILLQNLLYSHSIIGIICFGFVCINVSSDIQSLHSRSSPYMVWYQDGVGKGLAVRSNS